MLPLPTHHPPLQDKVQDLLSQQLDASDNEAVLQELQALEEQQLQEDLKHMPSVPTTTAVAQPEAAEGQQQQQQQAAAETAKTAEQLLADEFPSVPKTKVRWDVVGCGWQRYGSSCECVVLCWLQLRVVAIACLVCEAIASVDQPAGCNI